MGSPSLAGDDPDFPHSLIYQYDPLYGVSGVPNGKGVSKAFSPPISYSHNSDGYRDIEFLEKKKKWKVLALGSSFTYGIGLAEADRWSELLENRLCDTSVWNVSLPGYTIDQNFVKLNEIIKEYGTFDLVIYEVPHFNEYKLHLGPLGWTVDSRKLYLKIIKDQYEVIPANQAVPWIISGEWKWKWLDYIRIGYNSFVTNWLLFRKNESQSIAKAEQIMGLYRKVFVEENMDFLILSYETEMRKICQSVFEKGQWLDLNFISKSHKISDEVGHINQEGQRLIVELIMENLKKRNFQGLCGNRP